MVIQMLKNMLQACVIEFKGDWIGHFPLVVFG